MTGPRLAPLGHFLAGADVNLDDLREVLAEMSDALAEHVGSLANAHRCIVESMPADKKKLVAALLPKAKRSERARGRPKGAKGERAYAKAYALYDVYCFEKAKNPDLTRQAFAENILDKVKRRKDKGSEAYFASLEAIDKSLRRAPRKLTPKDKENVEKVAKLVGGKD